MGKSKPRNKNKNRDGPTGKTVKLPSDPELAAIREQRILPVLKDLQSAGLKTRSAAAIAIANLIKNPKCRKLLLREQIVRILFEQTLTDSSLESRTAGWGILRNLALEEEADFCIHLYRQDILTAIEGVIRTVIQTIESEDPPFSKLPKPQQGLVWSLTSSVISLISSLSEAQDEIVEVISKLSKLTNFLFGLLAFHLTPVEVENEILSCLIVLTEDNKPFVQQIVDNGNWLKGLIQIKDSAKPKAVAACGVLHNVFTTMHWFDHNTPMQGASDAMLVPTLVQFMKVPGNKSNGTNGHAAHSSPDQVLRLALEITASIATSLQEALEHGIKHEEEFEGFEYGEEMKNDIDEVDADDEDGDGGQDDEDDSMDEEEIEADMSLVTGSDSDEPEGPVQEVTLDRIVRIAAPKLLLLARPSASSENEEIQSYALSALNNTVWTISSIDFSTGHLDGLKKFWSSLAQRIWNEIVSPVLASNTADIELASSITSLAWSVARSVQGVIQIKPEEQRKFMALYQASKGFYKSRESDGTNKELEDPADAFQGLGVKVIGVLGRLALDPAPVELNREIGVFLLTVLAGLPDSPAADTVEALDQIFDIYADKSYAFDESVFWADGFYKHLEDILPKAKKMAKGIDKRKFIELRARTDEAILNLGRFLKYKRTERSQGDK